MRRSQYSAGVSVLGLVLLAGSDPVRAEPPPGQSAYLSGMHDPESASWIAQATGTSCDRGWITDLQYLSYGGANCHTAETGLGISVIQRLDYSPSESIPHDPAAAPGYASSFADFVSQCSNLHVWIVGNEPNVNWSEDVELTSTANAAAYAAVHAKVHSLAGHQDDLVLLAPDSPYSPQCLCSLHKAIQKVKAKGIQPDGYAVHAYTQALNASDFGSLVGFVTDDSHTATDGCGYTFRWHFRIYRDWIKAIEDEGDTGRPVFLTESGNACAVKAPEVNECYPNDDSYGYFQALWGELDAWNASASTKVRAITPYRWTLNDDGTKRDFEIGSRDKLLKDLQKAFDKKPHWTEPSTCGPSTSCLDDSSCAGASICDLASNKCVATTPCQTGGTCPGAGMLCRASTFDCVPATRGTDSVEVIPSAPDPNTVVKLRAFSTEPRGNVQMGLSGPGGEIATEWGGMEEPKYHWYWGATLGGAGTYRMRFSAETGTVFAIGYFNAGNVTYPADAGSSEAGASDVVSPAKDGSAAEVGSDAKGKDGGAAGHYASIPNATEDSGCSCGQAGTTGGSPALGLVLVVGAVAVRRRRRGDE